MDAGRWKQLRSLFEEACDLPDGERTRFIESARERDPEIGAELARLVTEDRAGSSGMISQGAPWGLLESDLDLRGKLVASYKILHELGRGGMGQVWVAEQQSPKRLVALKTLRGMTSERTRRRFLFESELLARLRHPGIATVFEAGSFTDREGVTRPWFAMELVEDAQPLADFVRTNALDSRKTIELFLQVCDAVQHGHQHGVIHRDLKPQNILVDARGRVKVIDFGVARVTDDAEIERSFAATMDGQLLGTPDYMSPEQLERGSAATDTRSDVWALGVILYEILTGSRPFELGDVPLTRAAQALAERKLRRPSRVAGAKAAGLAQEIDWILMRAIARTPEERYASAGELAAELRRYLRGLPILAGRPGVAYLLRGFVRRHRVVLALASAFLLALLAALYLQHRDQRLERESSARAALATAHGRIAKIAEERSARLAEEARVLALEGRMMNRTLTRDERAEFAAMGEKIRERRRARDAATYEVLELLARAERLDPELAGIDDTRAAMWMENWREAKAHIDASAPSETRLVQFRRELELARGFVVAYDREGRFALELRRLGKVRLRWTPADAELHLFRYRDLASFTDSTERRLVPVPCRRKDALPGEFAPGSYALRVVHPVGGIERDDVIFELAGFPIRDSVLAYAPRTKKVFRVKSAFGQEPRDVWEWREARRLARASTESAAASARIRLVTPGGSELAWSLEKFEQEGFEVLSPRILAERGGVEARLLRDGGARKLRLPVGLGLRTTAAPLFVSSASRATTATPYEAELAQGLWVALLRKPGYESRRVVMTIEAEEDFELELALLPVGTSPRGFVHLAALGRREVWMQDREVRCDEYLRFLNDPSTRAEVDAAGRPMRFPRYTHNENRGGYWPRDEDGNWSIAPGWRADWPAVGVSYEDAVAYCDWYTEREHAAGRTRYRYILPERGHWYHAAQSPGLYVFGDEFRQQWIKSCFSRTRPCIEPVLSYPVDESPYGLFDMSGSAFEWLDDWFWKERKLRTYIAGSWAMANPELFGWARVQGATETAAWDTYGFRMCAVLAER